MTIIGPLIKYQQQLRVFHWQTNSYAQHKAFGKTYEALDDLIDNFVETYQGKFGKIKPNVIYKIELKSLDSDSTLDEYLNAFTDYLKKMSTEIPNETDLLNIRDEMLGTLNRLKYLLTFK